MDNIWDILIPVFIIGGVMLSAFSERQKKQVVSTPTPPPQKVNPTDIKQSKDVTSAPLSEPAQTKKSPKPFLSPITHSPSPKVTKATKKDNAYAKKGDEGEAAGAMEDVRRAIIAHEILKRKF